MNIIDVTVRANIRDFIGCLMMVLETLIIISMTTAWFLLVAAPVALIYFYAMVMLREYSHAPFLSVCVPSCNEHFLHAVSA